MMPKRRYSPYALLEEARKGWGYFISDEVVYEGKRVDVHSVEGASWVDSYLKGDF